MSRVQSVIFDKTQYNRNKAKSWLSDHGFKNGDIDEKENSYRFRQFDPSISMVKNRNGTVKKNVKYVTKTVGKGIRFIIQY